MKTFALAVSLGALIILFGCSGPPRLAQSYGERSRPKVTILRGNLAVTPNPIYFARDERGEITWELNERSTFRFSPNAVVIEGRLVEPPQQSYTAATAADANRGDLVLDKNQDEIICPRQEGGRKFFCINRHTRPGIYKYSIRVGDGTTEIELDPSIVNM
jgi:hypothetical protein